MTQQTTNRPDMDLSADLDLPQALGQKLGQNFGQARPLSEKTSDRISDRIPPAGQISDKPSRWHIEINADRYYPVAAQLFKTLGTRGFKRWQVIIDALLFYAAALSGNPHSALKDRPHLLVLFRSLSEKTSDNSPSLSLLDSESESKEKDLEKEKRIAELSEALARVCKKNLLLKDHKNKIEPVAAALEGAQYTPAQVVIVAEQIYPTDWRYKRGQSVTLAIIVDRIGEAATWQADPVPEPKAEAAHDPSRYLAHEKPADPDPLPEPEPIPEWIGAQRDLWIGVQGELQIEMQRATYDTWIKPLRLVEVTPDFSFRFVASTQVQVWLRKSLDLERKFNKLWGFKAPQGIKVEVFTEEEWRGRSS